MTYRRKWWKVKEDPAAAIVLLAVLPREEDRAALRNICDDSAWELRFAGSFQEAQVELGRPAVGVVISDCHLSGGYGWKDVLNELRGITYLPPLIVADRLASDQLWAEVLNLGCYDLLMKPFDATEVVRVITSALQSWNREWWRTAILQKPTMLAEAQPGNSEPPPAASL